MFYFSLGVYYAKEDVHV